MSSVASVNDIIYTLVDSYGYVGSFSTRENSMQFMEKYPSTKFMIFELCSHSNKIIVADNECWIIVYNNLPIYGSKNLEDAKTKLSEFISIGHIDESTLIEYCYQVLDIVPITNLTRLDAFECVKHSGSDMADDMADDTADDIINNRAPPSNLLSLDTD